MAAGVPPFDPTARVRAAPARDLDKLEVVVAARGIETLVGGAPLVLWSPPNFELLTGRGIADHVTAFGPRADVPNRREAVLLMHVRRAEVMVGRAEAIEPEQNRRAGSLGVLQVDDRVLEERVRVAGERAAREVCLHLLPGDSGRGGAGLRHRFASLRAKCRRAAGSLTLRRPRTSFFAILRIASCCDGGISSSSK